MRNWNFAVKPRQGRAQSCCCVTLDNNQVWFCAVDKSVKSVNKSGGQPRKALIGRHNPQIFVSLDAEFNEHLISHLLVLSRCAGYDAEIIAKAQCQNNGDQFYHLRAGPENDGNPPPRQAPVWSPLIAHSITSHVSSERKPLRLARRPTR